jgi:DNA-directed RNA polymerase specialized sigma24 family protein
VRRRQWAAFEDFVQVNGDTPVRLSFLLCGDHGQAEDAVQEALTRVYLRWGRLDDPLPYARRSVVNQTRDQWRNVSRREERERSTAGCPRLRRWCTR